MAPGNMLTFNVDDGYLEAILRGYRSGILTTTDYINLTQCENLEDVRMHLTVRGAPFSLLQASRGSRWRSAWLRRASACVRKCSSAQSSA
ncbi:hypothetical protein BU14_0728s0001, partial [Porphyra umbilicalis]